MSFEHNTNPDFWKTYNKLPENIQKQADKQFALLEDNPRHPSLHFKKVGKVWSARVTDDYRALAISVENGYGSG